MSFYPFLKRDFIQTHQFKVAAPMILFRHFFFTCTIFFRPSWRLGSRSRWETLAMSVTFIFSIAKCIVCAQDCLSCIMLDFFQTVLWCNKIWAYIFTEGAGANGYTWHLSSGYFLLCLMSRRSQLAWLQYAWQAPTSQNTVDGDFKLGQKSLLNDSGGAGKSHGGKWSYFRISLHLHGKRHSQAWDSQSYLPNTSWLHKLDRIPSPATFSHHNHE